MNWSLWRNDELLGEIIPRDGHSRVRSETAGAHGVFVNGILLPVTKLLPLRSVRQHTLPFSRNHVVHEHDLEPDIVEERFKKKPPSDRQRWVALAPITNEELSGVAPEQQLQVRDAAGRIFPTSSITVLEHRPQPEHPDPELAAYPAGVLVDGSLWLVMFAERTDLERRLAEDLRHER
jgi:hypothetical protein